MSLMLQTLAMSGVPIVVTVTLSGEIITADSYEVGDTRAGVRISSDGKVYQLVGVNGAAVTPTQIDTATDWIQPNSAASGPKTYHVKAVERAIVGGGFEEGTLDTYIEITGDHDWVMVRKNAAGDGTSSWDLTLHISEDGGSSDLDTANYDLDAIRELI